MAQGESTFRFHSSKIIILFISSFLILSCSDQESSSDFLDSYDVKENEFISGDMILFDESNWDKLSSSSYSGFRYYKTRPWPQGVMPIEFAKGISNSRRTRFFSLCNESWGKSANVRCVPWDDQVHGDLKIYLTQENSGCWSHVGAAPRGIPQTRRMNLSFWGCWSDRVILHEIGHALGLLHEHQRPDRDNYVKIYSENAEEKYKYAFRLLAPRVSNVIQVTSSYDFNSIMHYNSRAFSKNGRKTIVALPEYKEFENSFGRISSLSRADHLTVQGIYGKK